jgi:hypothetical protein
LPQFKLAGGPEKHQGLYFYRNDRLLQAGGEWPGIHVPARALQLARVTIDIDDDVAGLFTMNPEKSHVQVGPDFAHLAESAKAEDGTTFADYLREAEQKYTDSRKRSSERVSMFPPGKGFAPELKRAITAEIPLREHEDPVDIRWRRFEDGSQDFFEVDRDERTLWLNERYRPEPASGQRRSVNDAPLLKSLLYLLMEDIFKGEYLGPRDKDNIELWQQVLTAAVGVERS